MKQRGRRRRLRGLERGGRDRLLGRGGRRRRTTRRSSRPPTRASRQADPSAKVLLGPLTGNNYNFLGQVYAAGAGSSFDAAAVHTDTACLVDPPSSFYREDGNVARFTFLGFRTVHDVDGRQRRRRQADLDDRAGLDDHDAPPARAACGRARSPRASARPRRPPTSRRPTTAWPAIPTSRPAMWFTLKDTSGNGDELNHYGLQRTDGAHKPSWDAFQRGRPRSGDQLTGPCGDFDAPVADRSARRPPASSTCRR